MLDLQRKAGLLSRTELFAPCGKEMVEQIAEFSSISKVSKGTTIFKKGDAGNSFYIVKQGEVAVIHRMENRQEHEIARYGEGDFFGEVDMLMNTPRNAEARAAEDSEILRFPGEDKTLQDLLLASPPAGAELLCLFMQTTSARIRKSNERLKENSPWVREMRQQVYCDNLTGLYNRTFLEENLPGRLRGSGRPASLLMLKPDNFKYINDTYGHDAGDQALVAIGAALAGRLPAETLLVRYMGNELACFFPDTGKEAARELAGEIQSLLNTLDLSAMTEGKAFQLSVSIGIAVYPDNAAAAPELIALAHELPLLGRERGGNVILFPEDK